MREFRLIFVLLFFLPSFAIANTEIINVETGDSNKLLTSNSVCDIELSNNSSIPLLLKPNPTIPQAAGAPQQSKYTFSVCGLKPLQKYQIRASWPAVVSIFDNLFKVLTINLLVSFRHNFELQYNSYYCGNQCLVLFS